MKPCAFTPAVHGPGQPRDRDGYDVDVTHDENVVGPSTDVHVEGVGDLLEQVQCTEAVPQGAVEVALLHPHR